MHRTDYCSRYSRHGYGCDVRATYAHLPFQAFWTWVTGKSLNRRPPQMPSDTLLREWQLWAQIGWSWSIIFACLFAGSAVYHSDLSALAKFAVYLPVWLLVVNRTRGLLHTFHYTNHGASIANMQRARWIATVFMSIPILHTSWRNYHQLHAKTHHSPKLLCTDADPDQKFVIDHGFYRGMPEREYWLRVVFAPFHPRNAWAHIHFRLAQNFWEPVRHEIILRSLFWLMFFVAAHYLGILDELAIFYLFPLLLLTQHSSWVQHITEHLWLPVRAASQSSYVFFNSLTWGRFLGRPYPKADSRVWQHARWWLLLFAVDLPMRLYSFMQDLPSHDFHHRSPRVNFWRIAPERAAAEGRPSKFGPMCETWGVMESLLILRDHLCRGQHDPFGLVEWDARRQAPKPLTNVAQYA